MCTYIYSEIYRNICNSVMFAEMKLNILKDEICFNVKKQYSQYFL